MSGLHPSVGEPPPPLSGDPVFGSAVHLGTLSDRHPVAVVFFRYAGSAWTRSTADDLNSRIPALEEAGGRVIGVVEGSTVAVRDFVPRFHLLFPVLHDTTGDWYDAWGVARDARWLGTLRRPLRTARSVRQLALGHGRVDGPLDRLPAAFVVHRGRVRWCWRAVGVHDPCPLDDVVDQCTR